MQRIVLLILLVLSAFYVQAGHLVTGKVTDKNSGDPIPGVNVMVKNSSVGTTTDLDGRYELEVISKHATLVFSFIGYATEEVAITGQHFVNAELTVDQLELEEVVVTGYDKAAVEKALKRQQSTTHQLQGRVAGVAISGKNSKVRTRSHTTGAVSRAVPAESYSADYAFFTDDESALHNTEGYSTIHEIGFKRPQDEALSTFSIDVDAASYSNIRRFLNYGQKPPKDAVRIEEMVNYFRYDYEQPKGGHPFAINTEISKAPWNEDHLLVQIGLQGREIPTADLPPSNLVFLIDVSGSMSDPNKLPLLKSSFKLLVRELRTQDRVAMVVYAGAAGLVLPSTPGSEKQKILNALDRLNAGGSTAGGAGIELAYKAAKEYFVAGGNNRVIIATDGDFNVGSSSNAAMERLIEKRREEGVFLTVLGFGRGNYKDDKMEILADKGNGNYAYIDNIREAQKVFIHEFGGTLFTIAKDVKIQVEFNPSKVQGYRLIGYENRMLAAEDFNDDKKDAGELGSGHTVTALYELIPVGIKSSFIKDVDPLKYQTQSASKQSSDDWLTVKFRYKEPQGTQSKLIVETLGGEPSKEMSQNLQWASAVAGFGMLLRDSEFKGSWDYEVLLAQARSAIGKDPYGYRKEFTDIVHIASGLFPNETASVER
ncbi:MAG: von Willebrand factor type A domain-containing protein [Bacteroidota bacterium]